MSVLYSIPTDWFETRQRFHPLAEGLAERMELTVLAPRSHRRLFQEKRWFELLKTCSVFPLKRGRICSVATLPFYRKHPLMIRLHWKRNVRRLQACAKRFHPNVDILWIADPTQAELPNLIPHRRLVYECVDEHAGFWSEPSLRSEVIRMEEQLVRRADLVVATSRKLADRLSQWSERVVLSGNGVDLNTFTPVVSKALPVPPDIPAGCSIGYYGALGEWVDTELLRRLALERPGLHFVLIGPIFIDPSFLEGIPNLHWIGMKPFEALPHYLAHIPLWIIPFRLNDLTKAVDPLKVYEYLAAGRRVVSTSLPELIPLQPYLSLVESPEEWLSALDEGLKKGPLDPTERQIVWQQLASRDWRAILEELLKEFERLQDGRPLSQ